MYLFIEKKKIKYMEAGRHRGMMANEHISIGSNSHENVKISLGSLLTNKHSIQEEIESRLKACY